MVKSIDKMIDELQEISNETKRRDFYRDYKKNFSISYKEFLERLLLYIYRQLKNVLKNMDDDDKRIHGVRNALGLAYVTLIDNRNKYNLGVYDYDNKEAYIISKNREKYLGWVIDDIYDIVSWYLEEEDYDY